MHGSSRKRSGSRVLAFCRQHPDKMLGISTPYTCQETTVNFYFFNFTITATIIRLPSIHHAIYPFFLCSCTIFCCSVISWKSCFFSDSVSELFFCIFVSFCSFSSVLFSSLSFFFCSVSGRSSFLFSSCSSSSFKR